MKSSRLLGALLIWMGASRLLALQAPPANGCYVYPCPATGPTAVVVYTMPGSGTASVLVYDEAGDLVSQTREYQVPGFQQTSLDLSLFRSGVYFCRVRIQLDAGGTRSLDLCKFIVAR